MRCSALLHRELHHDADWRMRWLVLLFLLSSATSAGLALADYLRDPRPPARPHFESALPGESGTDRISLVALLADPVRYDQRRVTVSGYLVLEFEHLALYLDQASQEAGLQENGVWIIPPAPIELPSMQRLSRRYVTVEGAFDATEKGYGAYSGALGNIRSIRPTRTEREFRRSQLGWTSGAIVLAVRSLLFNVSILTVAAMMGLGLYRLARRLLPRR